MFVLGGILVGLALGVGVCEYAGRRVAGYSVVLDTVDYLKRS